MEWYWALLILIGSALGFMFCRCAGGTGVSRRQHHRLAAVLRRRGRPGAGRAQHGRGPHHIRARPGGDVHPDGRNPVPLRRRGARDRRGGPADAQYSRPPRAGRRWRRLGLRHPHRLQHGEHGGAQLHGAAGDAPARLPHQHVDGPDHGHRRHRDADPALGNGRAAGQPVGHLDLAAFWSPPRSPAC